MAQETQSLGTILLSRPLEDSKRVAPDFERLGLQVIISPILDIQILRGELPPHDVICLSSKNAIPALEKVSKDTPIYCVGTYTQTTFKDEGFEKVTSAPTAKDLLPLLKQVSGQILYLAGTVASLDFSEQLSNCTKYICYEAVPVSHLNPDVLTKPITYAPLYSVRSAELLIKLLDKNGINLNETTFMALSEEVAKKAQELDIKKILIAKTPTHQGIIDLLCEGR